MGKKEDTLNKQIDKVNKELNRLSLDQVSGVEERALVDSAYDQMGISTLLQQMSVTVSVLVGVTGFLLSLEPTAANMTLRVVMVAGVLLTLFAFPTVTPGHQSAKAVELIVMHRANRPDLCKPET